MRKTKKSGGEAIKTVFGDGNSREREASEGKKFYMNHPNHPSWRSFPSFFG
jgi:hypothetical protein